MAKKKLSQEQRIDLLKGFGKGFVELIKSNKAAGYAATSLGILALGKLKLISCSVTGVLQGVATYIAISDVVEEAGDAGFFGLGGMGETIAKGGTLTVIGTMWGLECQYGRQPFSIIADEGDATVQKIKQKAKEEWEIVISGEPTPRLKPEGGADVWWWPDD